MSSVHLRGSRDFLCQDPGAAEMAASSLPVQQSIRYPPSYSSTVRTKWEILTASEMVKQWASCDFLRTERAREAFEANT